MQNCWVARQSSTMLLYAFSQFLDIEDLEAAIIICNLNHDALSLELDMIQHPGNFIQYQISAMRNLEVLIAWI